MTQIKVSEASGVVLDWMVAKCEGITTIDKFGGVWVPMLKESHFNERYSPSTDWAQGGPIIEREKIGFKPHTSPAHGQHTSAWKYDANGQVGHYPGVGSTPLIAAMRCYVVSKLGDTVEVPDELIGE